MAVSAFKSTSKRGNLATSSVTNSSTKGNNRETLDKKIPHRRSRSVSAVSRIYPDTSSSSSSIIVDFLNKRDNPLFCSATNSSPSDLIESKNPTGIAKFDKDAPEFSETISKSIVSGVSDGRRGRSVSRSSGCGKELPGHRESGRSLSKVDIGRRQRSVSRGHYGNYESEIEHEYSLATSLRNRNIKNTALANGQKIDSVTTNASELSKQGRNLQTWSSQHPLTVPPGSSASSLQAQNWDDGVSTSSYSEAEEKTIKAVFEQMKSFQSDHPAGDSGTGGIYETVRSEVRRAVSEIRNDLENTIQRKNSVIITTNNIADIPPELVNPDAIELVSDIRREYAAKLEQSQERARKLRADLAVEEQRGQELGRILKEVLPEPKISESQNSRPKRKTSIERRKMSRRLAEEAMNYFDECVSISTFDSSDFSAPEDPPLSSVAMTPSMGGSRFPCRGSNSLAAYSSNDHLNQNEESENQDPFYPSYGGLGLTASSSKEPNKMLANGDPDNLADHGTGRNGNFQFPFALEATEKVGIDGIRSYIKNFEKEFPKDGLERKNVRSSYDEDNHVLRMSAESLLFDKVIFRNRIEAGGLLLCGFRLS